MLDRAHSAADVTHPTSVYRYKNTERPVTATQGTNRIVGNDPQRIVSEALVVLDGAGRAGRTPELWDGRAAERIVAVLHSGGRRRGTNER